MRGAEHRRLHEFQQLQGKGSAEQIVLLAIQGALNLLPSRQMRSAVGLLKPCQRGNALPCVLNETLPHFMRQHLPPSDKSCWVPLIPCPKLVEDNAWQHVLQLRKTPGPG